MSNLDVIQAFTTLSPHSVKSKNLYYDSYRKSIFSYDYKIGYWLYVPNEEYYYAVIRAHDNAPSKTTAEHMRTLAVRSRGLRSLAIPILTPELFDKLPDCKGERGWDRSYYLLYRAAAVKAARAKQQFYQWRQKITKITENLDRIAAIFGWSYDRSLYTVENVLADSPKLLTQFALRDMGVWD